MTNARTENGGNLTKAVPNRVARYPSAWGRILDRWRALTDGLRARRLHRARLRELERLYG